jgi:DNA repair photolyase
MRRAVVAGDPVVVGSPRAPYRPAELRHGLIRSLLEAALNVDGLEIAITTSSPQILLERDLLVELDKRNAVTIRMAVPTLDAALARRIDSRTDPPETLLEAVAALAAERIATIVLVAPVVAGVNDSAASLRRVMEAAAEAEACDVEAFAEGLSRKQREPFRADFERLRLIHGFPRAVAGRG